MKGISLEIPQQVDTSFSLLSPAVQQRSLGRIAVAEQESSCYLTVRGVGSHEVLKVDYLSGTVIRHLEAGRNPDRISLAADGRAIYVTVRDEGGLSVIDLETGKRRFIKTGERAHGLAITPDGHSAFVGSLEGKIFRINLATLQVVAEQEVAESSFVDLAITPDGRAIFAANYALNQLWSSSTDSLEMSNVIPIDAGPICLAFDAVLNRLHCTCQDQKRLVVLAYTGLDSYLTSSPRVMSLGLPTPATPVGVDVSPNAERVFVALKDPPGLAIFHVNQRVWYPVVTLPEDAIGVAATTDSRYVLVTTQHLLIRIVTNYGFGTGPEVSRRDQ